MEVLLGPSGDNDQWGEGLQVAMKDCDDGGGGSRAFKWRTVMMMVEGEGLRV